MAIYNNMEIWMDYFKQNKFKSFLIIGLVVLLFGAFVRLYKMECSRQTGVCVVSQFYLEKLSYQKIDKFPLSRVDGMVVSKIERWKSRSYRKRSGTRFYQLQLLTKTDTYNLEMIETPWFPWNKGNQAEKFNHFLKNTSQMTYTYKEGKGFIWAFFGLLALAWVMFKKFYDESKNIHYQIFNTKRNIKNADDEGV